MTDSDAQLPEFPITLRGYEREHVDQYILRLQRRLEQALEGEMAEPELPADWHAQVGPRVAQIFDLAVAEAEDVRAAAEREADLLRADARQEAVEIITAATTEGRELSDRRRSEWEGTLGELEAERARIRREVEELQARKATVLEDLRRLHAALGMAPGLVDPPDSQSDADAVPPDAAETRVMESVDPTQQLPVNGPPFSEE